MIFSPAQAAKLLCPQRSNEGKPLACLSNACAWWRYADQTSEYGFCGAAGEPPVYRLQSGDYPIRRPHTVLTRTLRTVDQGSVPTPGPHPLDRAIAQAIAEDAVRDAAARVTTASNAARQSVDHIPPDF